MEIDEKELWESLQNCNFDVPEIKLIMNCIESAKKPNSKKLIALDIDAVCLVVENEIKKIKQTDGDKVSLPELTSAIIAHAVCKAFGTPPPDADKLRERTAQLIAHRVCCGSEHDPTQGKLHGYCIVCGVHWPCEYAGNPSRPANVDALAEENKELREAAKIAIKRIDEAIYSEYGCDVELGVLAIEMLKDALGGKTEGEKEQ